MAELAPAAERLGARGTAREGKALAEKALAELPTWAAEDGVARDSSWANVNVIVSPAQAYVELPDTLSETASLQLSTFTKDGQPATPGNIYVLFPVPDGADPDRYVVVTDDGLSRRVVEL